MSKEFRAKKRREDPDSKFIESLDKMFILEDPNLFNRITEREFDKKIVGEIDARKTIFLVTCMRLVENLNKATDNLMINAVSGTGKDCVTEAVFGIIPPEQKEELIRISPKVLAYTRNKVYEPEATWKKSCLRLEDVNNAVLNDNAFKVMSSADQNKINRSKVVWKGRVINYEIEGKPPIILTIADPNPREETLRRYPICNLDEGRDQTKEILKRQAEYAKKGIPVDYDEEIIKALRLLERVKVKVPFADRLVKFFNPENVIVRTHFPRFLDYIKTSCAIHQKQRRKDYEEFYIAEPQDYDIGRIALIQTTSNILMIPLTKLQKNILEVFEEENIQKKSVDEIIEIKKIERLNITSEWLRKQLQYLTSKTFLIKDKEKRTDEAGRIIPKPVFVYSFNKLQKLEIPKWRDLEKISSNTSNNKNTSISSNTSNTQVSEVSEVNDFKTPIEVGFENLYFLEDVPELIGSDGNIYGGWKSNTTARVPSDLAKNLIQQKKAIEKIKIMGSLRKLTEKNQPKQNPNVGGQKST